MDNTLNRLSTHHSMNYLRWLDYQANKPLKRLVYEVYYRVHTRLVEYLLTLSKRVTKHRFNLKQKFSWGPKISANILVYCANGISAVM